MTTPLPPHLTMHGSDPRLLGIELLDEIKSSIEAHPRSQQVEIGPSEIGTPCSRKLGYKFLGYPEKAGAPNWKATVGTYIHSGLEEVFDAVNLRNALLHGNGDERYLIEQDLACGMVGDQVLRGHCDIYDRVTNTSIDWKTVGPTQLKKYKANGPGNQYRVQGHVYGRGWQLRGFDVQRVAVMFLPRNGELADSVFWCEDYDEQVAIDAIARVSGIKVAVDAMGPAVLDHLPSADNYCSHCPYFKAGSNDLTQGCPGDPASRVQQPSPPPLTLAN